MTGRLQKTFRELLSMADAPATGGLGMVHGFAQVGTIAERVGKSRSQVSRDLRRLEALGWIAKATREPVRFNLGLAFTVFDAPSPGPVRLVGVPKGPWRGRAGMLSPEGPARMPDPQETPRMLHPKGPLDNAPQQQAPSPSSAASLVVVEARRAAPEPAEPAVQGSVVEDPRGTLAACVRAGLRLGSLGPGEAERLAALDPRIVVEAFDQLRAKRATNPAGAFLARWRADSLPKVPNASAGRLPGLERIEEAGAVSGEERKRLIRQCRDAIGAGAGATP